MNSLAQSHPLRIAAATLGGSGQSALGEGLKEGARPGAGPAVVLAGGGTGGHVVPALALADAFTAAGSPVLFIGTEHGYEARMVPKRGYAIELVAGSRLVGGGFGAQLRGLWNLAKGVLAARRILARVRPRLVVGVGGYASGAALLAARSMGIPCAIHESNAVPGVTNRVLGRLVQRAYLGFDAARPAFAAHKTLVSGNPVRAEIAAVGPQRRWRGSRSAHLLVVGGSQGSEFLNIHLPALAMELAKTGLELQVRHQVGKLAALPVEQAYQQAGVSAQVEGFIDDMAAAYAWADVAVTRAGSGTVAELAAAALPSLLVPFPFAAGDHQAANAAAFCAQGGGRWVRQADWKLADLTAWAATLLTDDAAWLQASASAAAVALPQAAAVVVGDCGQWLGVPAWQGGQP